MTRAQYVNRFRKIYAGVPAERENKARELIARLADVLVMMDECRAHLSAEGCVTSMPQGNYSIERENPYSRIYDAKHKLMLATIEKLDKMLPAGEPKSDELMDFLRDGGCDRL